MSYCSVITSDPWIPISEAAEIAGVSRGAIYAWAKCGSCPTRKVRSTPIVGGGKCAIHVRMSDVWRLARAERSERRRPQTRLQRFRTHHDLMCTDESLGAVETVDEIRGMEFLGFDASWVMMLLDMAHQEDFSMHDLACVATAVRERYRKELRDGRSDHYRSER